MNRTILIALGMAIAPGLAQASGACEAHSGPRAGALLELYTSEGCSSCPPADRWFRGLAADADPQRLSLLAFHVDYWDELGWPDRFARHAYTVRQSGRVRAGGSSTIYTPQVMLSSGLGLHWYQPQAVSDALALAQQKPSTVALALKAERDAGRWRVSVQAKPLGSFAADAQLYLALYENSIVSAVKAGENGGATLHHDRVVRGFWGPWPIVATGADKQMQVTLPADARVANTGLTAFVQTTRSGETLQALSLPFRDCAE